MIFGSLPFYFIFHSFKNTILVRLLDARDIKLEAYVILFSEKNTRVQISLFSERPAAQGIFVIKQHAYFELYVWQYNPISSEPYSPESQNDKFFCVRKPSWNKSLSTALLSVFKSNTNYLLKDFRKLWLNIKRREGFRITESCIEIDFERVQLS